MNFISRFALTCLLGASIAPNLAAADSLSELAQRTHYHGIAFARSGTSTLLLATHHGVFAVDKNGNATQASIVQDYMGFSATPTDPLTYFASGHPQTGGNSGFLKSVDGGATWNKISDGVSGPVDFHQMDVSLADPHTIYGGYGRLQVSHDDGQTWAKAGPLPNQIISIAASGQSVERIYAATQAGLLISADGGGSWKPLAFASEVVSMVRTGPKGELYAFVLGKGLLRADEKDPANWKPLSNNFGEAIPLHMAINSTDNAWLALTTQDNAVLESHDAGASWKPYGTQP